MSQKFVCDFHWAVRFEILPIPEPVNSSGKFVKLELGVLENFFRQNSRDTLRIDNGQVLGRIVFTIVDTLGESLTKYLRSRVLKSIAFEVKNQLDWK